MAREQTDQHDKRWNNYHAIASHSERSIHIYTWTCPDCETVNTTHIDTSSSNSMHKCNRGVKTRCGHCHGNTIRLTDKNGLTWDPYDA